MIITIARECGCYGDLIGEKLGEKLGIPVYDKVRNTDGKRGRNL